MNTIWGLDLDMSAVRLMRRDGLDWLEHRSEKIDGPDIEDRLKEMIADIDEDAAVTLFLPRDQILFTDVALNSGDDPRPQIEAAMNGRTPYTLEELALDWEVIDGNKAFVAAIARDTLDEAAAFAEVRNLPIGGYSTLFYGDDFPRAPVFDGPNIAAPTPDEAETATTEPPQFATARVPSRPPDADVAAASMAATAKARFTPTPAAVDRTADAKPPAKPEMAAEKAPVVNVEDTDPVVKVKAPSMPLDPGIPIAAPNAPPRIRTDIAAASVSGHAASLTPGGLVKAPKRSAPISTAAVFAMAFLLTIGVAVLVWNYLPMRPSTVIEAPTAAPSNIATGEEPEDSSALSPDRAAEESTPIDLPLPATPPMTAIAEATAPETDEAPVFANVMPNDQMAALSTLPIVTGGTQPAETDLFPPNPLTPDSLANIQISAPTLGTVPQSPDTSDGILLGAFELPQLSTDAIALPSVARLSTDPFDAPEGIETADIPLQAEPTEDPVVADVAPVEDSPQDTEIAATTPTEATDTASDDVASAVNQALVDALAGPGGLIQTQLAASLPDTSPAPRIASLGDRIERQQFGGRTRSEMADIRPPARPDSAQTIAEPAPVSDLAVAASLNPRGRPGDFEALVAAAEAQQEAARLASATAAQAPDTSGAIEAALQDDSEPEARPAQPQRLNIPTNASVARQATIEDAIRLNRVNLVGVYGNPSDRRALVRLPSGRYVKVKVGDRIDGGTVARITDDELYYRKGNRTLSLQIPRG